MSDIIYSLMLFSDRHEGFFIGLFESNEKAKQIAEYYLSYVTGFQDYPCTYEITEKMIIGLINHYSIKIYMIWGWNKDENGDETDIWSSDCYTDYKEAQIVLTNAKHYLNRQEWSIDVYQINQCHWTDGFIRIFC